jgi:hypothetical protein
VCPVAAIYTEDDVPSGEDSFTKLNYDYFIGKNLDELKIATDNAPRNLGG